MFLSLTSKNKGFDKIHVSGIFRCQDIILQLPGPSQTDGNILLPTMKLIKTIRNKVLNYRDTVQAISVMTDDKVSFLNNTFPCLFYITPVTVKILFIVIHIANIYIYTHIYIYN